MPHTCPSTSGEGLCPLWDHPCQGDLAPTVSTGVGGAKVPPKLDMTQGHTDPPREPSLCHVGMGTLPIWVWHEEAARCPQLGTGRVAPNSTPSLEGQAGLLPEGKAGVGRAGSGSAAGRAGVAHPVPAAAGKAAGGVPALALPCRRGQSSSPRLSLCPRQKLEPLPSPH